MTTPKTTTTTAKSPKGYEGFINSIPKQVTKLQPINQNANNKRPIDDDEYYYDDEDDNDDDDYALNSPPLNKSKYVPMSETMAPRPTTPQYRNSSYHHTQRPWTTTTESQFISTTAIPSFIQFPKDIFYDLKPIKLLNRFLNTSTLRPYTTRTRVGSSNDNKNLDKIIKQTKTKTTTTTTTIEPPTTKSTISTTTRKIYTIRPNRGQSKWKISKSVKSGDKKNLLDIDDDDRLPNR